MKNSQKFILLLLVVLAFISRSTAQEQVQISLKPGEKTEIKIAATNKTLVLFNFEPTAVTQEAIEKQAAGEGTSAGGRVKINDRRPLRVQIVNSRRTWQPEIEFDAYAYRFILPNGLKEAGVVRIENISKFAVSGSGEIELFDASELASQAQEESQSFDEANLKNRKDGGDMSFILHTLAKRHVAGYPGGKGDLDEKFEKNLEVNGVSMESVQILASNWEQNAGETRAKVKTKKLLETVGDKHPVRLNDLRKIGVAQPETSDNLPSGGVGAPISEQFKYTFQMMGIKSRNCACDNRPCVDGHKCDSEEGWVNYVVIGPNLLLTGSDDFHNLKNGREWMMTKTIFNNLRVRVGSVITVLWQIVEDDDGGDSQQKIAGIYKATYQTALDIRGGNYAALGRDAEEIYEEVYDAINRGEDDYYNIQIEAFDSQKLYSYMTGTAAPPSGSLFNAAGKYRNYFAILIRTYYKGSNDMYSIAFRLQGVKD